MIVGFLFSYPAMVHSAIDDHHPTSFDRQSMVESRDAQKAEFGKIDFCQNSDNLSWNTNSGAR
jgi:hypothetical protein